MPIGEGDAVIGILERTRNRLALLVKTQNVVVFIRPGDPKYRSAKSGERWSILVGKPHASNERHFEGRLHMPVGFASISGAERLRLRRSFSVTFDNRDEIGPYVIQDGVTIRPSRAWRGPRPALNQNVLVRYKAEGNQNLVWVVQG